MPPRFRVRLTPQSLSDIEEIHRYIARRSPNAAAKMIERILDAIEVFSLG